MRIKFRIYPLSVCVYTYIDSADILFHLSMSQRFRKNIVRHTAHTIVSWPNPKQEIAANCEKYIRAKDTQVSLMIFSSEFKLVKPFIFLSFIFESTDRYNVFHMTHT